MPRRLKPGEAGREPGLTDSLRLIMGTDHSVTTPNNALVVLGLEAAALRAPAFLIELGGHSAAPDRDEDAEFHPGSDVNWNLTGTIWGTRDAQAVSGLGYLGRYQAWMTLPRTPGTSAVLRPGFFGQSPVDSVKHVAEMNEMRREKQAALGPPPPRAAVIPDSVDYALRPVRMMETLVRTADSFPRAAAEVDRRRLVDRAQTLVNDSIVPLLGAAWGSTGLPRRDTAAAARALRALARWELGTEASVNQVGFTVWEHRAYRGSPIGSLKRRLYRPTLNGMQNVADWLSLLTFGAGLEFGGGGKRLQTGLVVPVFSDLVTIPGILELAAGWARQDSAGPTGRLNRATLSVVYDRQYKATVSYYVGFDWTDDRRFVEADPRAGNVALIAGGSVMPFFWKPDVFPPLTHRLRFRVGLQLWKRHWHPSLGRLEARTVLYLR